MIDLAKYNSVKELAKDLTGAITFALEQAETDVGEAFDKRVLEAVHDLSFVKSEEIVKKMDLPYQNSLAYSRIDDSLKRLVKEGKLEWQKYVGKNWIHSDGVRPVLPLKETQTEVAVNG